MPEYNGFWQDAQLWSVSTLAQAAMFVACGVDLKDYERMLDETGIRHVPIPSNFAEMAPFVEKIQDWAAQNRKEKA